MGGKISKEAKRAYDRKRYAEKKHEIQAVNAKWAANNKARMSEYKKQWRRDNIETRKAWESKWRAVNREKIKAQHKKFRLKVGSNYLRIKNAQSRAKHPGPSRHRHLKKRYGMSLAQYEVKLASQLGACAICGVRPEKRRLAVDHDHYSGAVRDLLCFHCNAGLGHVKENINVLLSMAAYLKKWGKR